MQKTTIGFRRGYLWSFFDVLAIRWRGAKRDNQGQFIMRRVEGGGRREGPNKSYKNLGLPEDSCRGLKNIKLYFPLIKVYLATQKRIQECRNED